MLFSDELSGWGGKMVSHHAMIPSGLTVDILESNVTGHTFTSEQEANLDNLYPALVQCFGIILLGFVAGKFSFISDVEARGLGTFVGTFSLPALIFVSLCQGTFKYQNFMIRIFRLSSDIINGFGVI